ncbi:nucleotidyltransferase family protein [Methylobacillus flagellatus]|uniref:nucleotidyltransferase family protein n=1 Tax=Methylobacillus flagellatus TaxID=405 RepID=UPI00257028B7|nr:nucleotidyltransferase family protein [Methylobacillus flagellatus]
MLVNQLGIHFKASRVAGTATQNEKRAKPFRRGISNSNEPESMPHGQHRLTVVFNVALTQIKRKPPTIDTLDAMNKSLAIELLKKHKSILTQRFGVSQLALFGSTARNEATENSDIDILVDFDGPASSERYFGVQFYLEDLLARPVDLVTHKALRKELRPYIEREAIRV